MQYGPDRRCALPADPLRRDDDNLRAIRHVAGSESLCWSG
jgi:hypothetical protein